MLPAMLPLSIRSDNTCLLVRQRTSAVTRTVSSPFIQSILAGVVLGGATLLSMHKIVDAPTVSSIAIITSLAFAILLIQKKDVIWFEASLFYNIAGMVCTQAANRFVTKAVHSRRWYSEIPISQTHEKLILGALPLINHRHHSTITSLPGSKTAAVLSVLRDFEMSQPSLFGDPVTAEDWKKLAVKHKHITAVDLQPISIQELTEAVEFIHECLNEGRSVYVHCKAGQGRSCTVIAAYLLTHEADSIVQKSDGNLVEQVLNLVLSVRPQIFLTASQKNSLYEYHSQIRE